MPARVTAVFQDGVLKPTRKLKLRPNEKVTLQILRQDKGPAAQDLGVLSASLHDFL